jgi:NAD(P)-dependent dehydrogenase (short-subunit alcohol dehydrogenase family)
MNLTANREHGDTATDEGIVVMTGATSGIGAVAARRIARTTRTRLLVGARGERPDYGECINLDLANLESVRAFAGEVEERRMGRPIDVLILNAAVGTNPNGGVTAQGYEVTFAVNHLAHYLLLRLLMPALAPGARVVITTSNTHDPRTSPVPPRHADAERLAHPKTDPQYEGPSLVSTFRAYASSKLCNVLTARALATSPMARDRGITVVAYNPGFTPGTGLGRNLPMPQRVMMQVVPRIVGRFRRINTRSQGGELLADLALGRIAPPLGHIYASVVRRQLTWPDPSELARDDVVMAKLWADSARLVGLPEAA